MGKRKINEDNIPDIAEDYAKGEMRIIDICNKYGFDESTWYRNLDPDDERHNVKFVKALKKADEKRMQNLADLAELGMKKLLTGYEYEETQTIIEPDSEDGKKGTIKEVRRTKKKVKPDRTMIMFVATNRAPKKWKHRSQIGLTNADDRPLKVIDVSPEDLKDMDASSLRGLFDDAKE